MAFSVTVAGMLRRIPTWQKFRFNYASFSIAATSNQITVFNLPAGGLIHAVKIKHSVKFEGGSISTYTISVGVTATANKYSVAFDVFQTVSATAYQVQINDTPLLESHTAATAITADATASHNLSTATAGIVEIWVLWSKMV